MEHHHRNSGCSHETWWIFPVRFWYVYQRVNLHFPMGFPMVSHGFPIKTSIFLWFSYGRVSYVIRAASQATRSLWIRKMRRRTQRLQPAVGRSGWARWFFQTLHLDGPWS